MSAIYYCNLLVVSVRAGHLGHRSPIPDHADPSPRARADGPGQARRSDLRQRRIIDHFIDVEDVKHSLDLHRFDENEPYYLGMF